MPVELRTSERRALHSCPQNWFWSQVEGLEPKKPRTALWFGFAVHEALAAWYLPGLDRGPHPTETFDAVLEGDRSIRTFKNEEDEAEYVNARELGIDMLEHYIETYGRDEHKFFIATEEQGHAKMFRPEMKLFGRTRPRQNNWLTYHFTWDGVYRDLRDDTLWLDEHKTAASIQVSHLPLDNQAGSYWALATPMLRRKGLIGPNEEIEGIMYNFLRKAMRDTRPRDEQGLYRNKPIKQHYIAALEGIDGWDEQTLSKKKLDELESIAAAHMLVVLGEVSKVQPPAWFERFPVYRSVGERQQQIERIKQDAVFAEAYREGWLPVVKSPGKECGWCQFFQMCQLDEQGDQDAVEAFKETEFKLRDPYIVYRKSAE